MTKKHFIAMAADFKTILANSDSPEAKLATRACIEAFMSVAAGINGSFDYARFRTACGM